MILAIDAVGAKHGGAASVLLELVQAALNCPEPERVVVFCSPRRMRRFELPRTDRLREVEVEVGEAGPVGRIAWQELGLARAAAAHGVDRLLCLSGGGRAARPVAVANLIQQSLPFLPEARSTLGLRGNVRMAVLRASMGRSCRRASVVFVQTQVMRELVGAVLRIDLGRIAVVEPVPAPVQATNGSPVLASMRAAPEGQRLLYVGNDSPYKNLGVLREGLVRVRRVFPQATLFTTLGPGNPEARRPGVVDLGYLAPEVLAEAYAFATLLVMPSLAETVGLPMLEAAGLGVPVLAADRPYAREVCAGGAAFFDPHSPEDLAAQAIALLKSDQLRRILGSKGAALVAARAARRPYARMIELTLDGRAPGAIS